MNRFINAVLLFFTLVTAFIAIYVGFDLPISFLRTTGAYLQNADEIFLGLGVLMFMIVLRRSYRRWMAIRIVSKTAKFKWSAPVSTQRKKRIYTYTSLEIVVYTFGALGLYFLTDRAWVPAIALSFAVLDNIILLTATRYFRVALSSKALIVADREVVLLYFKGLRKVTIHQQTVYFDYIKDLQLSFPTNCIEPKDQEAFFELLKAQFNPDKVYFTARK